MPRCRAASAVLELFGLYATPLTTVCLSKGMREVSLQPRWCRPRDHRLRRPNSGLDVASTLILRRVVSTLAAQGKIVIYSSHLMDIVEKVCDDVVILHNSHVVAHDSVTRLRELAQVASLEQAFAALAVDQDVNRIGDEIAVVGACDTTPVKPSRATRTAWPRVASSSCTLYSWAVSSTASLRREADPRLFVLWAWHRDHAAGC